MPACGHAIDVVSATRRSSGVAPRACVRVYARVLVPPNLYIHTYPQWPSGHTATQASIEKPHTSQRSLTGQAPSLRTVTSMRLQLS